MKRKLPEVVSGVQFVSEEIIEKYYSETEDKYYFKPTDKSSFIYGVKFSLLHICKSLFEKLTQSDGIGLHFCEKCKQVAVYSKNDKCNKCGEEYLSELETCPRCKSHDYIPLCSKCGDELDCDYLSDILYRDLSDLEWIDIDDLSTIKDYICNLLK